MSETVSEQLIYDNIEQILAFVTELNKELFESLTEGEHYTGVLKIENQNQSTLGFVINKAYDGLMVVADGQDPDHQKLTQYISKLLIGITNNILENENLNCEELTLSQAMSTILGYTVSKLEQHLQDLKSQWETVYTYTGIIEPKTETIRVIDITNIPLQKLKSTFETLEAKQINILTTYHNHLYVVVKNKILYALAQKMLSKNWKIRVWPTYLFKEYYTLEGENSSYEYYNFDHEHIDSFTDTKQYIQVFQKPDDSDLVASDYRFTTTSGYTTMLMWLRQFYASKINTYNYERYCSYYNWHEQADFVDGIKKYKAYKIYQNLLVDLNGNRATSGLVSWLFKDDAHDNVSSYNGIATRQQVYKEWNLLTE